MALKDEVKAEFQAMLGEAVQVSGEFTNEVLAAIGDCEDDVRPDMKRDGLTEEEQDAACSVIAVKALWDAYAEALSVFEEPARSVLKEIVEASDPAARPDDEEDAEPEEEREPAKPAATATIDAPTLKAPTLKKG